MFVTKPTMSIQFSETQRDQLIATFGDQLQRYVPLARYTAARIGGEADWLLEVESITQLVETTTQLWEMAIPFIILGGGSNILVSDLGVREVVILNRARHISYDTESIPATVWAESGANFGLMARQCARRGMSGLEWAAGVPGTVGGAIFGNAGAHGSDVAASLQMAEILHSTEQGIVRESWPVERFGYEYRSSVLKRNQMDAVVLTARFHMAPKEPAEIQAQMTVNTLYRRQTQPPGASMGSMFKNPPGDYAGRLIEAAGLKGTRIGGSEISPAHANFFINHEGATAADVFRLIRLAQETVAEKFGIELELEIELIGERER
jgi:UDP-N-acetylmuramate dehydrogenase